ncbi:hypothetical protein F5Y03DRAFT_368080 [Xylaria venustula]|nr:hypothetical protein F5Y03DRAFT_368080 [Xylaria venustula]
MGSTSTAGNDLQKELLDLSAISDVTVQCGEKTWNLHSAILARRSRWFKTALLGGFKEATTRTIRIEEFDEESVGFMIEYIYNGSVDWQKMQGKRSFTHLCLNIIKLADYFLLPELGESVVAGFGRIVYIKLAPYHQQRPDDYPDDDSTPSPEPDHAEVFDIVREVYLDTGESAATKPLREILVTALDSVRYVINGAAFVTLMEEVPAFATDMMIHIWVHRAILDADFYAVKCSICRKPVNKLTKLGIGLSKVVVEGPQTEAVGICYSCDPACRKYGPWETSS